MAKVNCTCLHCGAAFQRFPSEVKRGVYKYCSHACFARASVRAQPYLPLTQARLQQVLSYDPTTGEFTWRVSRGKRKAGAPANSISNGYVRITIDRQIHLGHRLAWLYVHGKWPDGEIDHRDTVRNHNWIGNLRDVTMQVNLQNRIRANSSNKSSGLLGAYLHRTSGWWHSAIEWNGRTLNLGRFKTAEEAHLCFLKAKRLLHPGNTL